MKVCILGWYGTETLGDRAILDGVFRIMNRTYGNCEFNIGSLFPFFTERTLLEDCDIYNNNGFNNVFKIFDVKTAELKRNIIASDIVVMGGGPIMDLNDLYFIRKGFRIAKRNKIKSVLLGCGMGPLNNRRFINVVKDILKLCDMGIFRDEISKDMAEDLCKNKKKFYYLQDPAIISIVDYKKNCSSKTNNDIAINLRKQPAEYNSGNGINSDTIIELISRLSKEFDNVNMVPMHSFFVGGDDRQYLSQVSSLANLDNVKVVFQPPSLKELYDIFANSKACIGMRYHSVVIQTILCGNNYILDYTTPNKGKISGFINSLDNAEFYKNRYFNYTDSKDMDIDKCVSVLKSNNKFEYDLNRDVCGDYKKLLEVLS